MNSLMVAQRTPTHTDVKTVRSDQNGRLLQGGSVIYTEFVDASGAAYTAGDSVGALQTLTGISSGESNADQGQTVWPAVILDSLTVIDDAGQSPDLLFLFLMGPNVVATDNAAFTWGTADAGKSLCVGKVRVMGADWDVPIANKPGVAMLTNLCAFLRGAASGATPPAVQDISVVCIAMGAPTLGNGKKVRLYLGIRQ